MKYPKVRARPGKPQGSVRYARVPTSPRPCQFCAMLASRGAVYYSEDSALWKRHEEGEKYHDNCSCKAVPVFNGEQIPGYDKKLYYDMWKNPDKYPMPESWKQRHSYAEELAEEVAQPFTFTPAKTIEEANEYAISVTGNKADFSGLNIELVNGINESIGWHVHEFPELKKQLQFVGTAQQSNRALKELFTQHYLSESRNIMYWDYRRYTQAQRLEDAKKMASRTVGRVGTNEYAHAIPDNREVWKEYAGLHFNTKYYKDADELKRLVERDVATGYHPVGTGVTRSVVDHELGHALDYLLDIRQDPEFLQHYYRLSSQGVSARVSRYATKNSAEFIAEAWAEYLNNPTPREEAQFVGDLIRKRYAERFGK